MVSNNLVSGMTETEMGSALAVFGDKISIADFKSEDQAKFANEIAQYGRTSEIGDEFYEDSTRVDTLEEACILHPSNENTLAVTKVAKAKGYADADKIAELHSQGYNVVLDEGKLTFYDSDGNVFDVDKSQVVSVGRLKFEYA